MKIRNAFVSNSSSESFICKRRYNLEEVEAKLRKIIDMYNEIMPTDDSTSGISRKCYDDVFRNPIEMRGSEIHKELEVLTDPYYKKEFQSNETYIVIDSAYDNSIPYVLYDLIEEAFDAVRLHQG
jgi:hypothetical protein